jgi:hypothetical protein
VEVVSPLSSAAAILSLIDTWVVCSVFVGVVLLSISTDGGRSRGPGRNMSDGVLGVLGDLFVRSVGPSFFAAGDGEGGGCGESLRRVAVVI